jgi:ribosomal protein L39E
MAVHFLRSQRTTACGRKAKATRRDTRIPARVTCKTCRRVMSVWRRTIRELTNILKDAT